MKTKKRGGKSSWSLHSKFHLPTATSTSHTRHTQGEVVTPPTWPAQQLLLRALKGRKEALTVPPPSFSVTKFLKTESINVQNLLPCISNTNKSSTNAPQGWESPSLCLPLTEKGRQGTKQTQTLKGVNKDIFGDVYFGSY